MKKTTIAQKEYCSSSISIKNMLFRFCRLEIFPLTLISKSLPTKSFTLVYGCFLWPGLPTDPVTLDNL